MTRRGWLLVCSSVLCAASATVAGYAVNLRRSRPATRDFSAESELFQLINAVRSEHKLLPLREDVVLRNVAASQARNMGRDRSMAPPAPSWIDRELEAGGYDAMFWGGDLDLVYSLSFADAIACWLEDDRHKETRDHVLSPYFLDVGIGAFRDGTAKAAYVFLLFGKRKKS